MVRNSVEVTAQVRVDHLCVASIQQPVHFAHGVVRTPLRAVRILFLSQIRLKDRFQYDDCSHLYHPIFDRRYSQRPLLAVGFGNQNPPYRLRPVALFLQCSRQLFQPCFHSLCFDPGKTLPVDSATPAVGAAAAPGPQKHIFPVDLVIQCVKAVGRICLRFGIQRSLQLPNIGWGG